MRKLLPSPSRSPFGVNWSTSKRLAAVAVVACVLLATATVVAWVSGSRDDGRPSAGAAAAPTASSRSSPAPTPETTAKTGSVAKPPQIAEPVAYAKAAARMLWSYDTRDTSRDQQLAGMRTWMTRETKYTDWASVSGQVPDPLLWSRMADQDQHASAHVTEGHYPGAFKAALADDPSAITEAYIYVVTVNGKQQIAWKKGGSGAEERAVTLAVQCRPGHDCTLAAIAPSVTQ
ncbi:hypothetical protein [Streptomyces sp. NPDC047024]|uniref:hypothetical protein n=1 Tax=Streptomyces sp. NPDC047024 TaxID=3155476 RepID=UPI0033C14D3A